MYYIKELHNHDFDLNKRMKMTIINSGETNNNKSTDKIKNYS